METVYLTNSNFKRILENFRGYSEKYNFIITEIGNGLDKSVIFSSQEKNQILLNKNFILNYEEFYKKNELALNKHILRINLEDPYKLYNSSPAYHKNLECKNLKNDYKNFMIDRNIPQEILDNYKEWLIQNENLYFTNHQTFDLIHLKKWGNNIDFPIYKEYKNSGSKEILIDNIEELRNEIKRLSLTKVEKEDLKVFIECLKFSSVAKMDNKDIKSSLIKKYKNLLIKIHDLKMKIIDSLLTIYVNENNGCNVDILKRTGFKPCSCCQK